MKLTKLLILFLFLSLKGIAQTPAFGNTGAITLCVNGSYYLNPSTTDGTFSSGDAAIATINSSGYVTGVSVGTTTVSLVTGGGTVTASVTVSASATSSLNITDPSAQSSYKFNNNPQGPVGGLNNYVGYNGFSYSSQARPIKTGFFRASNQLGDAAGCPFEYDIFRCTTCGTVPEYATRPQGTFVGNTIQSGSNGQLTYTSNNSPVGGPFTIVYLPSGGSNITITGKSSGQAIPLGTITSSKTFNLISVTDEISKATTDFSGTIATVSVIPPSAVLSGSTSICSGTTANLSLSTTGTGSITVTLNNGTVFNTVSGTTTFSVTPTTNTTYSIASVTDSYGNSGATTSSATISIYAPASITVQPVSPLTINEGTTATLSVTTTGQPSLNYQWYKDGVAISLANNSSYTTTNTISAAGTYYVTVSTTCNVVSSTTSTVSVSPRPQGSLTGSTINQGGTGQLTYTSSNGGGPFTIVYQPSVGSNVTVTNVTSGSTISVTIGTPTSTTTYSLVSVTDETTTASRTSGFTGITATITVNILLSIGDSYQGGKIFYIFQQGDLDYVSGQTHGLIAATSDQGTGMYGSFANTGATGTAIGTGSANTNAIISSLGNGSYAAKIARDYEGGSYRDWYLPSQDELHLLYLNKVTIGGFDDKVYWSSSENNFNYAYIEDFVNGSQNFTSKLTPSYYVRAIRKF